jgi:uncharacterized UPF0160 family protein
MIEDLKNKVNADENLVRRGRFLSTTFLLEVGATAWLIAIRRRQDRFGCKRPLRDALLGLRAARVVTNGQNSGARNRSPARTI